MPSFFKHKYDHMAFYMQFVMHARNLVHFVNMGKYISTTGVHLLVTEIMLWQRNALKCKLYSAIAIFVRLPT